MHSVLLPAEPESLAQFEAEWRALGDDMLIEVFHLIDLLKRHGPDPDRRSETLDGFIEIYALAVKGARLKMMLTLDTRNRRITLLGFTQTTNWAPHGHRRACQAHGLIAPSCEAAPGFGTGGG